MNRAAAEKTLPRHPREVREAAQRALAALGWNPKAVGQDRFTAVWISRVFRFKDDVTVEIAAEKGRTKVTVRSASRVGHYDFGQNARHIEQFFEALERELGR